MSHRSLSSKAAHVAESGGKFTKKTDVAERLQGIDHAGLLVSEPPEPAGLPSI